MDGEQQQDDIAGHPTPAIELSPAEAVSILLRHGEARHQAGDMAEAELVYRRILQIDPENTDALHLLGLLAAHSGHHTDALELIGRAIALKPDFHIYHSNIGNLLKLQGNLAGAAAAYRRALAIAPDFADALMNLGTVLKDEGAHDKAISLYRQALRLMPENADVYYNLGNALRRNRAFEEAEAAFRKALTLDPGYTVAHAELARMLYKDRRLEEAELVLREWLRLQPDNPVARHHLAAITGQDVPPRASDGYVRDTFDTFAASFDVQLERLSYRAPELAVTLLADAFAPAPRPLDILDAGCGTGLCGPLLRPHARRLVGVDLSEGMLKKAEQRGVYDDLVNAELVAYLSGCTGRFDAIVSTDTLIYFGDLEPALIAAIGALRTGGWLGFTLEQLETEAPFRLNPHGRYSHNEAYVRAKLAAVGASVRTVTSEVLRNEAGAPVFGLVVLAQKPL